MATLAEVLVKYRTRKGWSQGQLAAYSRVKQPHISQIEASIIKQPKVGILQQLADTLSAPLAEFLEAAGMTDVPYRAPAPPLVIAEDLWGPVRAVMERVGQYVTAGDIEWIARVLEAQALERARLQARIDALEAPPQPPGEEDMVYRAEGDEAAPGQKTA